MGEYTSNLNLYKTDMQTDGDDEFDFTRDLDENWDKIDEAVNNKVSKIPADAVLYVSTTGSDTTGDGTSETPYATISKALDYLNGKTLLGVVTIQLANGTYYHTTQISINHPQGNLITIKGNSSDRTLVQLNFTDCSGFLIETSVKLQYLTISGNNYSSSVGVKTLAKGSLYQVIVQNFYDGIYSSTGGHLTVDNCLSTNNANRGICVLYNASATIQYSQCTYNAVGLLVGHMAYCLTYLNNTFSNNTDVGVKVDGPARISINDASTTISSNTNTALIVNNGGIVTAYNTSITGTVSPAYNTNGNVNSYIYR